MQQHQPHPPPTFRGGDPRWNHGVHVGVVRLSWCAFYGCSGLTEIALPFNPTNYVESALKGRLGFEDELLVGLVGVDLIKTP